MVVAYLLLVQLLLLECAARVLALTSLSLIVVRSDNTVWGGC